MEERQTAKVIDIRQPKHTPSSKEAFLNTHLKNEQIGLRNAYVKVKEVQKSKFRKYRCKRVRNIDVKV